MKHVSSYLSTRGDAPALSFEDAVLAGLASDGGLYLPEFYPHFSPAQWQAMAALSYPELAAEIIYPYMAEGTDKAWLQALAKETYAAFRHSAVAPLVQIDDNQWIEELFWGPTLAFKDFALQLLGRVMDELLIKRDETVTIVGATSGDTGSAAIAGCRGRDRMKIFILYPHGRVSDVQRRQMTTYEDANVHALAVDGTFDDCQNAVKAMFNDAAFRKEQRLAAVNSINWLRVLAQVVYYAYAALRLGAPARKVAFSVPTGNFGDILAGYIAGRMGLPIGPLMVATNRNDILTRTWNTGVYEGQGVTASHSPSMDIQISSNFERLLFELSGRDAAWLNAAMKDFATSQELPLPAAVWQGYKQQFQAHAVDDATTEATIADVFKRTGYLLDPHTAVGVKAAYAMKVETGTPIVTLATAHPAKFPDVVKKATGVTPQLPAHMADLYERKERSERLPNDVAAIQDYIRKTA